MWEVKDAEMQEEPRDVEELPSGSMVETALAMGVAIILL